MKVRLLWVVLAVSLALNLSFVGVWGYSAVTANETAKEGNGYIEEVADHLLLTEPQREGLMTLRRKARERWRALSGERNALRDTIVQSLATEVYDQEAVRGVVAGRLGQRAEVVSAIMGDLHAFMATLSPQQREAMLVLVERRGFLRSLFGSRKKTTQQR